MNFSRKHQSALRLRQTRFVLAGAALALLLPGLITWAETKPSFPAPTLVVPENEELLSGTMPTIVGLAKNDSRITVYIDGKKDGQFQVTNHPSGTANFAYQPTQALVAGTHIVHTTATGPNGATSKRSNRIVFDVISFFPAPTLSTPVVNDQTTVARPFIIGLAKNDSLIRIYIDGALNGQFQVKNHPSGTASFSYRSLFDLAVGDHAVLATAEGPNGKVSQESATVRFTVPAVSLNVNTAANSNGNANANGEVQGEATNANTETTNQNSNENDNSAGTVGSSDSTTNYPLIVGLGLLIAVVIVAIFRIQRGDSGSMARSDIFSPQGRSSTSSSVTPTTMATPTPPTVSSENKSAFPPPPPPLK